MEAKGVVKLPKLRLLPLNILTVELETTPTHCVNCRPVDKSILYRENLLEGE